MSGWGQAQPGWGAQDNVDKEDGLSLTMTKKKSLLDQASDMIDTTQNGMIKLEAKMENNENRLSYNQELINMRTAIARMKKMIVKDEEQFVNEKALVRREITRLNQNLQDANN